MVKYLCIYLLTIKNMNTEFKIWDKVVYDSRYYDKEKRWKYLDFQIINTIWLSEWVLVEINSKIVNFFRKATKEEIKLYFN